MNIETLFTTYGAEVSILALATIIFVGIIKVVFKKQFDRLEKDNCKPIYESLCIVLAFGFAALWLAVRTPLFGIAGDDISWGAVAVEGSMVYACVKVIYPLYENFKLRDFVQLIGGTILSLFLKKDAQGKHQNAQLPKSEGKEDKPQDGNSNVI